MDKRNEARHSSLLTTKTLCDANPLIIASDPSCNTNYPLFTGKLQQLEQQKDLHLKILIGYTTDKANKEGALSTDLKYFVGRIQTWAIDKNNAGIKGQVQLTDSQIDDFKDTILLSTAKNFQTIISQNPTIVPAYITTLRSNAFDTNITNFEAVIEMPDDMIKQRATATTNMLRLVKECILFRKDPLAINMKVFKGTSNNDFYLSYLNSLKIVNNPTSKRSSQGNIKDTDGNAIANVTCLVVQTGATVKSGPKGNFIFKSLPAGIYTFLFTKFGYQSKQITVNINTGERTDLKVILTPNP